MSAFGKFAFLLSSQAKKLYAAEVSHYVRETIIAKAASIQAVLNCTPKGYILVTDVHTSKSDPRPHFTVDAYGMDKSGLDLPIGCIHVYEDGSHLTHPTPRSKAWDAYKVKSKGSS